MNSVWQLLVTAGLAISLAAGADLPTADQVIAKCLQNYDSVKTYQATVVIHIDRGDQHTLTTMELKAENGANGMIARSSIHLVTSSKGQKDTTSSEMLIIDDGKTIFTVEPTKKAYWVQPHGGDRISGMFRRLTENAKSSVSNLKVTQERFHDRPVYRVAGSGVSGAVSIVVDKETFQLYSASGSGGVGAATFRTELTASNQVFNRPIDPSAFAWSPPPGYVKAVNKGNGRL